MKQYIFHIVLLLFTFNAVPLSANTIRVCEKCPIQKIQEGIDKAVSNDTVVVSNGTYKEFNILIDKPIVLIGNDQPVIDGENKGELITITSDNVTLMGFKLINVGISYTKDYAAVRVLKSTNFTIQNLMLEKLFFGIYLEKANYGKVTSNVIIGDAKEEYNSGNGIHLWYSNHIEITNNEVRNVRDGIYLEFANDCIIKNNWSINNLRYGLHFMFSNNDVYEENVFEKNGAGVAVMFSKNIRMYRNTFKENWGTASYGMLLKEINDSEIIGNHFIENTIGINIEGSNRVIYKYNEFRGNGWALKSRGACYGNFYTQNNFLNNSFDLSYNSKLNDNKFEGNYWSDYTGYDLNKDGVGDVPYQPVKLFSYVANRTPESIILLRSLFIDLIDFSEKVSPVFTPKNLKDNHPSMKKIIHD